MLEQLKDGERKPQEVELVCGLNVEDPETGSRKKFPAGSRFFVIGFTWGNPDKLELQNPEGFVLHGISSSYARKL